MSHLSRREALADFLKQRRAEIAPEVVGLPSGERRRTPGLRREEVAELAYISTAWYIKLEQAKDVQVSHLILDSIADALCLDVTQREYLFTLAQEAFPIHNQEVISTALEQMLTHFPNTPAYITDANAHLQAWNPFTPLIFGDFERYPEEKRNIMMLTFTDDLIRERIVNWTDYAEDLVGHFRTNSGKYLGNPHYDSLILRLQTESDFFRTMWDDTNIQLAPEISIRVQHPTLNTLSFTLMTFQMIGGTSLRMCVFVPNAETRQHLQKVNR